MKSKKKPIAKRVCARSSDSAVSVDLGTVGKIGDYNTTVSSSVTQTSSIPVEVVSVCQVTNSSCKRKGVQHGPSSGDSSTKRQATNTSFAIGSPASLDVVAVTRPDDYAAAPQREPTEIPVPIIDAYVDGTAVECLPGTLASLPGLVPSASCYMNRCDCQQCFYHLFLSLTVTHLQHGPVIWDFSSGRVVREMLSHPDPALSSDGGDSNNEHLIHQCSTSGICRANICGSKTFLCISEGYYRDGFWNAGSLVSTTIGRKRQYQNISTPTVIEGERTSVPRRSGSTYARERPIQPPVTLSAPATPSTGQLRTLAGLARTRAPRLPSLRRQVRRRCQRPHASASNVRPGAPMAPRSGPPADYNAFAPCQCLFRTARDKLRDADVPEFKVRLFAVAGSTQHELPTADCIGAVVYENGPESSSEFDVVIERYSGEPERINKLHASYMSLEFPLLFVYGEQGYHMGLKLIDARGSDSDAEKRMTMNAYYAYMLHDRINRYGNLVKPFSSVFYNFYVIILHTLTIHGR
ncbi:hypothetical protein CTI12_AA085410 [Artemisia annua]|uniref:Helitron helicase-like domain-containing protein n=1 Tax=Artemisia annua TaxID=35608 RepID=A0A2U1NH16_ARTAN|nr:hypothetical protein CTI12_AA085410 [Artemisia annua]